MNRNQEYWQLIGELGEAPAALDQTVQRAQARAKKARAGKWLGIPVASLGGVAAAFVLLVNTSTPFAMACRRVPLVRALAEAVAFEPSLKAALENDYIQPVEQTQTQDGVTLSVKYLIADRTQLNVFYTLGWEGDTLLEADPDLLDADGERLEGYAASWSHPSQVAEEDYKLATFYFTEGQVPESLGLCFEVRDTGRPKDQDHRAPAEAPVPRENGPWPSDEAAPRAPALTTFTFGLSIDPTLLGPGRSVELGKWIELDGQRLYLDQMTIDPTYMQITLKADPANTATLNGLTCYVEDGQGVRYERPSVTYGGGDQIQLDSPYFSKDQDLTLYITRARWLDKDKTSFTLDLNTGEADWLPEGMSVESVERKGENVYWAFQAGDGVSLHWNYYDPEGGEHEWGNHSWAATEADENGVLQKMEEYRTLRDYPWDTATIVLSSNRATDFPDPVKVPLTGKCQ